MGRENFGSKLGAVLAAAGSAVGLGNVWRFPIETGQNGGAAFIIIYVLCIIMLGLPIMISEFLIGRYTHANTAGAFRIVSNGSPWKWDGRVHGVVHPLLLCGGGCMDPSLHLSLRHQCLLWGSSPAV